MFVTHSGQPKRLALNWSTPELMDFHISELNTFMNYTAQDIQNYKGKYEKYFTHVIVAHTHFRPYVNPQNRKITNPEARAKLLAAQAKKELRFAMNCFNKLLYPSATNKPIRHPYFYRPLTFVTIEGANETTDKAQTIHFNITLGNLPAQLTTEDVEVLFKHAWHTMAGQSKNVKAYTYTSGTNNEWTGYTLKEAQQAPKKAWETDGIWDAENCWIPHAALDAD